MGDNRFSIREAVAEDVEFLAKCALIGNNIGTFDTIASPEYDKRMSFFREICSERDTVYSYATAHLVMRDGETAGAFFSYPGDEYLARREATYGRFTEWRTLRAEDYPAEVFPGEYYQDATVALPEARGQGFLEFVVDWEKRYAKKAGYTLLVLIVNTYKIRLIEKYRRIGFREERTMSITGKEYVRMVMEL